ncbi:hypothetical protein GVAV_001926 [Gurleya vavrai]
MKQLKLIIQKFLEKGIIDQEYIQNIEYDLPGYKTEDIPDKNLLNFTIPFFKNFGSHSKKFLEFFETLEYYKIVNLDLINIKKETLAVLYWTRENKLKTNILKKDFLGKKIDFEDRAWILDLLNYFYILAIEESSLHENISKMRENTPQKPKEMKIIRIEKKNDRKTFLQRINKPLMNLETYADMVMASLGKIEDQNNVKNVVGEEYFENTDKEEFKNEFKRKEQEKDDKAYFGSGNRKNMG